MMKDLLEEAAGWDLKPKHASLRWSSTDACEVKEDMTMEDEKKEAQDPLRKSFKKVGIQL